MRALLAAVGTVLLGGCSALPGAGPLRDDIVQNGDNAIENRYVVVDVDERAAAILARHAGPTFRPRFGDYRPAPDIRIGVGDEIRVLVWEASSGGLFSSPGADRLGSGSRSAVIPEQTILQDGTISVPYAGRIEVVGRSPGEVERMILERLAGKAIEPQAQVAITRSLSNAVTVTGEGTEGARLALNARGDRVLDIIGRAGGVQGAVHDMHVRLTRGNTTVTMPMEAILADPAENVFMRPGDVLSLVRQPQTYTAFGAIGVNRVIPFGTVGMTLEEAIAKAGGLRDLQSDPDGVFLFRFEPPATVRELAPRRTVDKRERLIPVVYRVPLRDAKSQFVARTFAMRDKDILYVANATSVDFQKFLAIVTGFVNPAVSVIASVETVAGSLSPAAALTIPGTTLVPAPTAAAPIGAAPVAATPVTVAPISPTATVVSPLR